VIADEQLTGASRDAVQARLDLWLKTHIERVLGPLFGLAAAEDVTGIARGVAFQLIEALGVLERQKVAEDVKGLDQTSRATLRKYGVRFGAYHLYVPTLLKPAPRSLAAQLWALKHESPEVKGLDELQRLASSGRTSIPVDKDTPKALYRTIGYRVCGERAIRVDILERLADLIRPALAWRDGAAGSKPAGAFDGRGFTVTGAMTSLTGASGEDFGSILRSLGYRMEKRPKPVEPPAAPAAAAEATADAAPTEAAQAEPAASEHEAPAAEVDADASPVAAAAAAEPIPEPAESPPAEPPAPEVESPPVAAIEAVAEPAAGEAAMPSDEVSVEAPTAEAAAAAAAPTEPATIEVWRPGRPPGSNQRRREGEKHGRRRHRERPAAKPEGAVAGDAAAVAAPAEAPAAAADATPSTEPARERRERRPPHRRPDRPGRDDRKDGERRDGEAGDRGEQRADRQDRRERSERQDRRDRGERPDRGDRGPRRDRRDDNRPSRTWTSDTERRGKEPDPNSPFAKLLALKEQLEGNKERQ
jgi:ATP-dependent RNA helicase SUPV3L1/SUV3